MKCDNCGADTDLFGRAVSGGFRCKKCGSITQPKMPAGHGSNAEANRLMSKRLKEIRWETELEPTQ